MKSIALKTRFCRLFLLFLTGSLTAQHADNLIFNASFEAGTPGFASLPFTWQNCGDPNESAPDLHGRNTFHFNVRAEPAAGDQYVGMVVRDNNTQECLIHNFLIPLDSGRYRLRLALAKPDNLESLSRLTNQLANYNFPVKLQILMRTGFEEVELWAETPVVDHAEWRYYEVDLETDRRVLGLAFIPMYTFDRAYNGSILLDDLSLMRQE